MPTPNERLQIARETQVEHVRDVLGEALADRLYVATDIEGYVDGFDDELFSDLSVACVKFKMRRDCREKRAEKCL
jgi:hypothetical protein